MLIRIITGLIGIPIVVALVFWRGGLPFFILISAAALLGLLEFYGGARKGGARPHVFFGLIAAALFLAYGRSIGLDMLYLLPVLTGFVLIVFIMELMREPRTPFVNAGVSILGVVYVVWMLLHFLWLREIPGEIKVGLWSSEKGAWLVMFVLLTTWAVDTGAYFIGKFYGKTKLAPNLSPGKTIEGSVGGFVSALVIGAIAAAVIQIPQPHGLILGGLIGITGQIGDLVESAFKREIGIKDFGALIPGHGGVLDRLDSLLFTGPVTFWYLITFLPFWINR